MESLLTLTIAVGGIATGVGAIWAALVARRQAQVSERSLAQTERSLAEQVRSLREQNERARLHLEVDLLTKLQDRFESPHFLSRRRAAAKYLIDKALVDGDMAEVSLLNRAVFDVCNFYEELGELQRLGALQVESVWNSFGAMAQAYWLLCKPAIEKRRDERGDPTMDEEFERLNRLGADLDRERGISAHTQEWLRRLMTDEAVIGEEPPTPTESE